MKSESNKSSKAKKIIRIVLIVILSFIAISFAMTKIIYDHIFARYEVQDIVADYEEEFEDLVNMRSAYDFYVGKTRLQGYLYEAQYLPEGSGNKADSVVIIAPGIHRDCEEFLPLIQSFMEHDYDVFIFDPMGCGHSDGKSMVGYSQETFDLEAAVDCVDSHWDYEHVFLFGHSRGATAVCAAAETCDVDGVVEVSGLNEAMDAIMTYSVGAIGNAAYGNYPFLWLYQVALFDTETMKFEADDAIDETGLPFMIVQGSEDDTATADKFSIYAHKDEIESDKVVYEYYTEEGDNQHTDILYEDEDFMIANQDLMEKICAFYEDCK